MNEQLKIPDARTRKREVERLRESNLELELVALALDDLLAMVESDLRQQRRQRIEAKQIYKTQKGT